VGWYRRFERRFLRDELPLLEQDEVVRFDGVATALQHRWWQTREGRLAITSRRFLFVPRVPRPLPYRLFGVQTLQVDLRAISSWSVNHSWWTYLAGGAGPWVVTIFLADGDKRSYATWKGAEIHAYLGAK
jgi:hypothetical protein